MTVGLAIQWGPVGDVSSSHPAGDAETSVEGAAHQRISSCLSTLDQFLGCQSHVVLSSMVLESKTGRQADSASASSLRDVIGRILGTFTAAAMQRAPVGRLK